MKACFCWEWREEDEAGRTRWERLHLLEEECCFITLPGNNVPLSVMNHYHWRQISKAANVCELHNVNNKGDLQCIPALWGASFISAKICRSTEGIVGNGLLQEINAFAGLCCCTPWHQSVLICQLIWFYEKMSQWGSPFTTNLIWVMWFVFKFLHSCACSLQGLFHYWTITGIFNVCSKAKEMIHLGTVRWWEHVRTRIRKKYENYEKNC